MNGFVVLLECQSVEKVSIHTGYLDKSNETFIIPKRMEFSKEYPRPFFSCSAYNENENFLLGFSKEKKMKTKIKKQQNNDGKTFFMGICYSEKSLMI